MASSIEEKMIEVLPSDKVRDYVVRFNRRILSLKGSEYIEMLYMLGGINDKEYELITADEKLIPYKYRTFTI